MEQMPQPKPLTETVIVSSADTQEKYKRDWKYKDYSFEKWEKNGFLTTKEGLPSKLDRECYELVRTPEFKNWFGDWEEKGENASKMIDPQTGEPQVFYRGDKSLYKEGFLVKPEEERTIGKYDKSYVSQLSKAQSRNQGVFFTDNEKVALEYGTDIKAVSLGKYNLHPEKDHPKTFLKIRNWLESFANKDPDFWKKVLDYTVNPMGPGVSDETYKRNLLAYFQRHNFSKQDSESLWQEVHTKRRLTNPGYYIDLFVHNGAFENLIRGFSSQSFKAPDAPFGSPWFIKFGSKNTPEWSKQFKQLALEYFSEPLALSTVFIRSKKPKKMRYVNVDGGFEIYKARIEGHDAFIHEKGVGKHTKGVPDKADEIIVYETENIWTVRKKPLAEEIMRAKK
ncbi:MAG: hypothetical protein PHF35_00400 [Candidatus Moranbacteria bacterium]|nr:hypothetical protein [Candidatus Moranbacteria bacterium]